MSFVEKLESGDRDLTALNLLGQVANESHMFKLVEKLPGLGQDEWFRIVRQEKLLKKDTATRYTRMMEFLSSMKDSADYSLSMSELSSNKSTPNSLVTGRTLTASATPRDDSPKPSFKFKCLACEKKGKKSDHKMGSCQNWRALSYKERRGLVKCVKHPFQTDHDDDSCEKSVGECWNCHETDKHSGWLCDKQPAKTASVTSKSASSGSASHDVLLKTMFVRCDGSGKKIGLIQDTGSTDNYVTERLVSELKLKSEGDIVLEIEGINSTKTIDSKVYNVPLIDKKGKVHRVECYSLEEITANSKQIDKDVFRKICKKFPVNPSQVKRPQKIDLLLSARSTHLMSDQVKSEAGGLRLYTGVLGKTISGQTDISSAEHVQSYPTKATPVLSVVKKAKLMKAEAGKMVSILAAEYEEENLSEEKKRSLSAEVYSLQLVVDMRTGEVRNLRDQLATLTHQLEVMQDVQTKLDKANNRIEDLEEQLKLKVQSEQ